MSAKIHARCERAPEDWRCSRAAGHGGPCAAHPHGLRQRLKWAWILRSLAILWRLP
jgi:hypothetical protein